MRNPVDPGMTENSDSGENPIYDVTCGTPSEFTEVELARCIVIIKAGDAVKPGSAARDLPRAKVIAVARKDSEIVGVGTIKPIRLNYARSIAGPKDPPSECVPVFSCDSHALTARGASSDP